MRTIGDRYTQLRVRRSNTSNTLRMIRGKADTEDERGKEQEEAWKNMM